METNNRVEIQEGLQKLALKRIRKIKRFYSHLLIYSIGVVVFLLNKYCNAPFRFPPLDYLNGVFISIWTFVIAVQGLKLFMREVVLGKNWENKQIDKMLESESKNSNEK